MKRIAIAPFGLRIPHDLRAELEKSAQQNNRTLTAEIIQRLQESYAREDSADYATGEDRPTRGEVLNLMLHGLTAGLDAFERARDQGASSADMHRAMKDAILEACKGED